ncbi:hypothetical protein LOK49_LG04G00650 [Camellia lanceoleosa]|uniref:Uncharacterized protein n=1 Tax=Camellia lanceoleosa TaxID=1840588 RepID=A0ACC0HU69_9ERIC|nr:hypothetical protein LOK49_LG04G00650 [Camellia lanceoleosa]
MLGGVHGKRVTGVVPAVLLHRVIGLLLLLLADAGLSLLGYAAGWLLLCCVVLEYVWCTMVFGIKTRRRKRATGGNVLSASEACSQEIGTPLTFSNEMQPPDDTQTLVDETQPGVVGVFGPATEQNPAASFHSTVNGGEDLVLEQKAFCQVGLCFSRKAVKNKPSKRISNVVNGGNSSNRWTRVRSTKKDKLEDHS